MSQVTSLLDREAYGVAQAANLLGLRTDKVRGWLDGYVRGGQNYPPVIRAKSTGSDLVTWGEFVELGYLREYRRFVALQRVRPVIERLREKLGTPYPLALAQPLIYDKELVLRVQEQENVPQELAFVVRSGQTIGLSEQMNRFFRKVEFSPGTGDNEGKWGEVIAIRPAGEFSPVRISPLVAFGEPAVDGVATSRLWELYDAGETLDEIADGYELATEKVRFALTYEDHQRSIAA